MSTEKIDTDPEEIRNKVKWLMALRVVIVTILMGAAIALKIGYADSHGSLPFVYSLIAVTYLLTILYALLLQRLRSLTFFAYCQVAVDIGLETSLVAATGGLASPFTFLYLISIISGSMILSREGGMAAAYVSSLLYGIAGNVQLLKDDGLGPLVSSSLDTREAVYSLLINVVAFITVGMLSSNLADKLKQTRRRLQEKDTGLTELKAFHENIVQSMSSGLVTADLKGRVTSFNRAAQEITGLSLVEVRGKACRDLFGWKGLQEFYENPGKISVPNRQDVETKKSDGSRLLLGVTLSPLRNEQGSVAGVVGTFQDLTKIRELEEEMRKREQLATIGEMAAGMAHEIRNPLASISGSMQVLRKELSLSHENQHLMGIALKETDRLNNIITEFLYYARPAPLNCKACDLHQLLEETIHLLRNSRDYHHGIEIRTDYTSEGVQALVDSDQIKQVFWNLSINAVQAMPGKGTLTIITRAINREPRSVDHLLRSDQLPEWGDTVRYADIIFEDTGEGISRDVRHRIFDPFFTTKSHGSGLGLAIVHRIIVDHHGRVWVESQPGRGARFTIRLPWKPQESEQVLTFRR